nr:carbohydrate ABC transporter permease [Clostridia bacterium]
MRKIHERPGDRVFDAINLSLLTCLFLVVLYPMVYIVSASISDPDLVSTGKMWLWPVGVTFEGYKRVLQDPDILTGYRNTFLYTTLGTLLNLTLTLPAAYVLSKRFVPGGKAAMFAITFTMYFSGGMVPSYLLMKNLKLLDTYAVLIVNGAVGTYNLIIARTFFANGVPQELEEAAMIDGCSVVRTFLLV